MYPTPFNTPSYNAQNAQRTTEQREETLPGKQACETTTGRGLTIATRASQARARKRPKTPVNARPGRTGPRNLAERNARRRRGRNTEKTMELLRLTQGDHE